MSIAKHHTDWRRLLDISGPFLSVPVLTKAFPHGLDPHAPEILERVRLAYDEWRESQEGPRPDSQLHRQWVRFVLQDVLGHPDEVVHEGQTIPQGLKVIAAEHHEELRPDLVIVNPTGKPRPGKPRLLVNVLPFGAELEKPVPGLRWKESPAGRMAILLRGLDVRLGLVTNGEHWMLVDAPREEATGFTTWQAWLWLDEHVTLRAFRTLLSPSRFFNVPEKETLEALLQESAEHQQEVTDQLGRQVRRAVEILVQALDRADRESSGMLLENTPEKEVYEAGVTFMMRLVFLFCAEERGLFPLDDEQYASHYAASTLGERLREAAEQWGEEVLERRTDAWQRLLATFRAVHGGVEHEDMLLQPYGGDLFDPDRYPFLEGRRRGTKWREASAQPLPIHNRTVLHLLEALQLLQDRKTGEAQRLSFLHLDIEQIGHVYEGLLDHTVKRATEPVLSLKGREGDEPEVGVSELERLSREGTLQQSVAELSDRSVSAVDADLKLAVDQEAEHRLLVAANNDRPLYERVRRFAPLIRRDVFGRPVVVAPGSLYVTAGADRRATGTHYTPRSLTEPIVRYTLEPLVYLGPAEGKPREEWAPKSARHILSLKVCDMACGSGAFLVQACRYLSERLVEAWEDGEAKNPGKVVITPEGDLSAARPGECIIPKDPHERLAVARRLVADRCLYGVDVNEMAIEMAKLSLWLITLQKGRAFSFLNHALKHGDSLLGVTDVSQVADFSLSPLGKTPLLFLADSCHRALGDAENTRRRLESSSVLDIRDSEEKARLLRQADITVDAVRLIGDLLVGVALADTPSGQSGVSADRRATQQEIEQLLRGAFGTDASPESRAGNIAQMRARATALLGRHLSRGRSPFHWPIEFPEVFAEGGFDAVMMNPPFKGGKFLRGILGDAYMELLRAGIAELRGSPDLVAYFVLRAQTLSRPGGHSGFISTKSILQGETRESSIDLIEHSGRGRVIRQVPNQPWPGDAAVFISILWIQKTPEQTSAAAPLSSVTLADRDRHPLAANLGFCFQGTNIVNSGFAVPAEWAEQLIRKSPKYAAVLRPLCEGAALNAISDDRWPRWIIDFQDWPLKKAQEYPECLEIVVTNVKPQRDSSKRARYRTYWWQFGERQVGLYERARELGRVIVIAYTSNTLAFAFAPASGVVYYNCTVVCRDDEGVFAILQSTIHQEWVREFGSTLKGDARYAPERCFEPFPFPPSSQALKEAGSTYAACRTNLIATAREGLTKTYNRFHTPSQTAAGIQRLRDLHVEMDAAVAAAYGWDDLALDHGFYETKHGLHFTLGEADRAKVLDRLLEMNNRLHKEEAQAGLHGRRVKSSTRMKREDGTPRSRGLLDAMEDDS